MDLISNIIITSTVLTFNIVLIIIELILLCFHSFSTAEIYSSIFVIVINLISFILNLCNLRS